MKVALQPAGSRDAEEHFENTMQTPVPQERLERILGDEALDTIRSVYGDSDVPAWGVAPGRSGTNVSKWERLSPGDVVLFGGNGKVFASGQVTLTFRDAELARALWGTDDGGDSWECIYLLKNLQSQDIPYERMNRAAGYKPNYVIQGFNVLDDDKSQGILDELKDELKLEEIPEDIAIDIEDREDPLPDTTSSAFVEDLRDALEARGLEIPNSLVLALRTGLSCQPFVLLAGPTGTGKTRMGLALDDVPGHSVTMVEVEGGWHDSASAFGYISPATQDFVPGPVLTALLEVLTEADEAGTNPVLLLDEINISPPHVYLAPLLSALEIAFEGDDQPLRVARSGLSDESRTALEQAAAMHDRLRLEQSGPFVELKLDLPPELRVLGTLNFDASTEDLAPKLLSRSFVVWFETPKIQDDLGMEARTTYSIDGVEEPMGRLSRICWDLIRHDFPINARAVDRARIAMDKAQTHRDRLIDIMLCGLVLPQLQTVMEGPDDGYLGEPFLETLPAGMFKDRLLRMRRQLRTEGMANLWLVSQ